MSLANGAVAMNDTNRIACAYGRNAATRSQRIGRVVVTRDGEPLRTPCARSFEGVREQRDAICSARHSRGTVINGDGFGPGILVLSGLARRISSPSRSTAPAPLQTIAS